MNSIAYPAAGILCPIAFVAVGFVLPLNAETPAIGERLGVNIHFTGAPARDLDLIAGAGLGWVRMDFVWSRVERERGRYDFRPYDELVEGLSSRGLRALFILDYSNRLYEMERSVRTKAGREAFARFAGAAAARYSGRGIRWEIWNEPNLEKFWHPQPAAADYLRLVKATASAVRAADPEARIAAPATSGFPWGFLEELFAGGLLDVIDEVSVHPYRAQPPETVAQDYRRLRELVKRHVADGGRTPAIISGEWGYSNWHWGRAISTERQGAYLARQFLTNLAAGIPLSIWYDWANDGTDPKNPEHNFGTVTHDRKPKPAYVAARTLTTALGPYRFSERLASGPLHLLVFERTRDEDSTVAQHVLAAWRTDGARSLELDVGTYDGRVSITRRSGERETLRADDGMLSLPLDENPCYVALPAEIWPADLALHTLEVAPLGDRLVVEARRLGRREREARLTVRLGEREVHRTCVLTGTEVARVAIPVAYPETGRLPVEAILHDSGERRLAAAPACAITPLPSLVGGPSGKREPALRAILDGDSKVDGSAVLEAMRLPAAAQSEPREALRLEYRFGKGWKFVRLAPRSSWPIPGRPRALSLWVSGDGSGNMLRCRIRDTHGEVFQPEAGPVSWTGWRHVTLPLDAGGAGHWGGDENGRIDYPLAWDTLILIDGSSEVNSGELLFADPVLLHAPPAAQ